MAKELRTVCNSAGVPVVEIVREDDKVTIYEADDMDNQIRITVSEIPGLIEQLTTLGQPLRK